MILAVNLEGSCRWQCNDCSIERSGYVQEPLQAIRYRAGRSPAQVAFERMGAARRNRAYRQRRREDGWGAW